MNWLTTLPLLVGAVANLGVLVSEALMQRLLTILLAGLLIGGVGAFAVAGFAWLWLKRLIGGAHAPAASAPG